MPHKIHFQSHQIWIAEIGNHQGAEMCIAAYNSAQIWIPEIEYYQKCTHMLRLDHRELKKS